MPDLERPAPTAERGGRIYLAVGAVVVAALIGVYILVGAPGLYTPVAKAPDVAQQPVSSPR